MRQREFVSVTLAAMVLPVIPRGGPVETIEDGWRVIRGDVHLDETLAVDSGERVRILGDVYSRAANSAFCVKENAHLEICGELHWTLPGGKQVDVVGYSEEVFDGPLRSA